MLAPRSGVDRRRVLRGIGTLAAGTTLAGCTDGTGGDGTDGPATGSPAPEAVSEFLSNAGNFDGTLADRTGRDEVTIDVGSRGNAGYNAFGPPAVTVSTDTTVAWEWTGKGGVAHNVVAQSGGDFASDLVASAGHTFSQTFEDAATVLYYCEPHRRQGMKGAVVVE